MYLGAAAKPDDATRRLRHSLRDGRKFPVDGKETPLFVVVLVPAGLAELAQGKGTSAGHRPGAGKGTSPPSCLLELAAG